MKYLKLSLLGVLFLLQMGFMFAQGDLGNTTFGIMPEDENSDGSVAGQHVEDIATGGEVWDKYKKKAYATGEDKLSLGEQFATGIMTRDTILDYVAYLVRFVGQLALLVGALAIIRVGYQEALKAFDIGKNSSLAKVIKGLIVIIFAYFIIKFLYSAFIR